MVDLDSNPTKLIEVVEVGKQLLITRGALTTFSIANDVAKYFAIIPAMFTVVYGQNHALSALNIMRLETPHSAVLSAVIFNALIIIALIPLALRGIKYRLTQFGIGAGQRNKQRHLGRSGAGSGRRRWRGCGRWRRRAGARLPGRDRRRYHCRGAGGEHGSDKDHKG